MSNARPVVWIAALLAIVSALITLSESAETMRRQPARSKLGVRYEGDGVKLG